MRELVSMTVRGHVVWGTRHLPTGPRRDVGVLLLNAGQAPRSGHGGLSARAADRLAAAGVPVFRFDLPGLGDSFGTLPTRAATFWRGVEEGRQAPVAMALAAAVRERYGLRRLVAGGLCGAAVNAIYAADRDPALLDGLLLLEPEFFLTPLPGEERDAGRARRWLKRLVSRRAWLRLLTGESPYGRYLIFARRVALRLLVRRAALPENVNLPLALSWARVVERGVPCLVITARGKIREAYTEQVRRAVLGRDRQGAVHHVSLPHTNHVLTSGGAIDRCASEMVRWLDDRFAADKDRQAA